MQPRAWADLGEWNRFLTAQAKPRARRRSKAHLGEKLAGLGDHGDLKPRGRMDDVAAVAPTRQSLLGEKDAGLAEAPETYCCELDESGISRVQQLLVLELGD